MNTYSRNPKIEILPEHIIDQIKAGEVLERPASLVKELIENSIDAGSDEINIHLIENGMDLLSIEDNGHGMTFQNLPYAFLRHATSKLKSFEDLYRLRSFGFRGEALASVAASARVTCTSQPLDLSLEGGRLIINGGVQEVLISQKQTNHGTSLFIKDLFFNTPARLKFIKSKISEKAALKKMLYAFVLSNPQINFSIKWDDKEKEIFKSVIIGEELIRIEQVFFTKSISSNEKHIWWSSEEYENYRVDIYFTPTTHSSPQYRHHYLFANNRYFQDKSFHQTILRNIDPLWRYGESGHYVVKISTPPEDLDVNVHPNKTQIKFFKPDVIYSLLVSAIRSSIKRNKKEITEFQAQPSQVHFEQNTLMNRDQNQIFDLQAFSEQRSSYDKTSIHNHSLNFQPPTQSSPDQLCLIGHISPQIILIAKDHKFFIAKVNALYAKYISIACNLFITNDESARPLLISEPFKISKGKIDQNFEQLKLFGFELDRLNAEVVALRTLPNFVPQSLAREITLTLLQYFENSKVNTFDERSFIQYIINHWGFENDMTQSMLEQFINVIGFEENEHIVKLQDKNLQAFFK